MRGCRDFKFQVCAPAPNIRVFPFYKALSRGFSGGGLLLYVTFFLLCSFASEVRAGDILRGGASGASGRKSADARANAGAQAAEIAKTKAVDRLAQTTKIINDMRQMQAEARSAAGAANIPNGLQPGGLQVLQNGDVTGISARWDGANAPVQAGNLVTIKQNQQQAVLHWKTFNVGKDTTVNFDQTAGGTDSGKWIAFNKIFDPSGKPSQILGSIKADGQVYVINQNGIIFGAGSQVNTRTFVASSLPINDNLLKNGLLNNKDAQFLFSALPVPGGSDGTPSFTPPDVLTIDGKVGDVTVSRGAMLSTPTSADGNGGRVMLVGANVVNDGTISTPSGQTILAAGLQAGIRAHSQSDPSLRGLDVWVGNVGAYGGTVTNAGQIESLTGSVLIVGKEINQLAVVESSTSVSLNGRMDFLASYGAAANPNYDNLASTGGGGPLFLSQFTGTVNFGPASVTRILPDYASTKTIPGTSLPEKSQVNVEGYTIHMHQGSVLLAPSANVRIRAGVWPYKDVDNNGTIFLADGTTVEPELPSNISSSTQRFVYSGGQTYFDSGSLLDISGSTDVFVPLSQNILSVQLRGSELADTPLQRTSILRGQPLVVDLRKSGNYNGISWVGTPLGDLTGVAAIIQRTAAQLTTQGGNLNIQSGGSVIVQNGAVLDVSGGYVRNEAGKTQTSRVLRNGNLIDISKATPDMVYNTTYDGMSTATSTKWGVTKKYLAPLAPLGGYHASSYIEGAAGGGINLIAPTMVLSGDLVGNTITGPRQLNSPTTSAALSISFQADKRLGDSGSPFQIIASSPYPPTVNFVSGRAQVTAPTFDLAYGSADALPANLRSTFSIGTSIYDPNDGGFGTVTIDNRDGDVVVTSGTRVLTPAGGGLIVKAANISIQGSVVSPGGSLSFTAYNYSPFLYEELNATGTFSGVPAPAPVIGRGLVSIQPGVHLDVSGMIVDERPTASKPVDVARAFNGGSVAIEGYNVSLGDHSSVDASGSARAKPLGGYVFGTGGSISILAGKDPVLSTTIGGSLVLNGTLAAYSATTGGKLAIQASLVQIGGSSTDPTALILQPDFFTRGGFTSYSLTGIGKASSVAGEYIPAVRVVSGTTLNPVAESLVVSAYGQARGGFGLQPTLLPQGQRQPTSLSFKAIGSDDAFTEDILEVRGDVIVEQGTRITTDPLGHVSFSGDTVTALGSIVAPAGQITIAGKSQFRLPKILADSATYALPTVFLGPESRLLATGTTVLTPDPFGRRLGNVYAGGSISVSGNILAESGAVLDVSGTSAFLDIDPAKLANNLTKPSTKNGLTQQPWGQRGVSTRVDSNGGTISLEGSQMLLSDASLVGFSGGPTATGGLLAVSSGRFYQAGGSKTGADINLNVVQSGRVLASTNTTPGVGKPVLDAGGSTISGQGYFAVDRFLSGGFDSLDLGYKYTTTGDVPYGGNLQFQGPITINARGALRVAGGGVAQSDSAVVLSAPYIAIGQAFRPPLNPSDQFVPFEQNPPGANGSGFNPAPTYGPGSVTLNAQLIDLGTLVLQNTGKLNLNAPGGDIRGNGVVSVSGDVTLNAGQVYPTTLGVLDIFAYDYTANGGPQSGTVKIFGSGVRPLPLSAGGAIRIFASKIVQAGTLRAPLGSITLGWDGNDYIPSTSTFDRPLDAVAGTTKTVNTTLSVVLESGSTTSVSGVDPSTGKEITVPFGLSPDGLSWIDPRGVNVTLSGLPTKQIVLGGNVVASEAGSVIDLRGGGDLLAYRWISGTGGSRDLLAEAGSVWSAGNKYGAGDLVSFGGKTWSARVSIDPSTLGSSPIPTIGLYWSQVPDSYAVIPGYAFNYSPYGAFNTGVNSGNLGGEPGYVSASLSVGDRIYLNGSDGLPAGTYTLLPRRYGLMPGAYIVTPTASATHGQYSSEGGANFVSGYRFNAYDIPSKTSPADTVFEVISPKVAGARAAYDIFYATKFMPDAAKRANQSSVERLPTDAGSLAVQGNTGLRLSGGVLSAGTRGGRGVSADLSSSADIFVVGGSGTAPSGATVVLNEDVLKSWGIESLLIGGLRQITATGTALDVRSNSVTVSNSGSSFSGPEILLAAKQSVTVAEGSSIKSSGAPTTPAASLSFTGDGALLWVSGNSDIAATRAGVTGSTVPRLTIGAGALISGTGVIADSSYGSDFDPTARIVASALTLNSGQVSILLQPQSGALAGAVVNPQLVLSGTLLEQVQRADRLTIGSYRSIDIYGAGTFGSSTLSRLTFRAGGDNLSTVATEASLRGFNQGSGAAVFVAGSVVFENPSSAVGLAAPAGPLSGEFRAEAQTVHFGANNFGIAGYGTTSLVTTGGVLSEGSGIFSSAGDVTISAPLISGAAGSNHTLIAGGAFRMLPVAGSATVSSGLGATLAIKGTSIIADSKIILPSGLVSLTASTGDVTVGGQINVAGSSRTFYDLTRYADAGNINVSAGAGHVELQAGSLVSVAAADGGGNAGTLAIYSQGPFQSLGTLLGNAPTATGSTGLAGTFLLDAGSLTSFDDLTSRLDAGGFTQERNLRIRTGSITVSGITTSKKFTLSTDAGSILVTGTIDAHGKTGGEINLFAHENITLASTAFLDAHGNTFSAAGKGGSISIEAGSQTNGAVSSTALLDIQSGSRIDLSVASYVAGDYATPGSSAFNGQFTGTLHLRAPQRTVGSDLGVAVSQLRGDIVGASSILVEGFTVFDLAGTSGQITGTRSSFNGLPSNSLAVGTTQRQVYDNGVQFMGTSGATTSGYTNMVDSLLGVGDPKGLLSLLVIAPGAEIINTTANGDISLGNSGTIWSADWNLADFRFGPKAAAGVLTLRTPGDIVFWNTLSDGFTSVEPTSNNGNSSMWLAQLKELNPALPLNTQSWSFRIAAGADLNAVDFHSVLQQNALGTDKGSVLLGRFYKAVPNSSDVAVGPNGVTASTIRVSTNDFTDAGTRYQVIRTGTGDIEINASRDVQLRNQFATIYTAGVRIPNPSTVYSPNDFVTPVVLVDPNFHPDNGTLGALQQIYDAQWALSGGNLKVSAGGNIGRYTQDNLGNLIVDSSHQLPGNWLYRRGYKDASTGNSGAITTVDLFVTDPAASTAWWIDYSNFYEGFGALGGGNVSLVAGKDVVNADAAAPTNARMPGVDSNGNIALDASKLLEYGGGDILVKAGNNISGGVYYVERGTGVLTAGGSITTNSARSPSFGLLRSSPLPGDGNSIIQSRNPEVYDSSTWLPTTLYLGKGGFNITANSDVLLGPVVNAFLMPQGLNNMFWYKTYFNTYASDSSVKVTSVGGSVTHRLAVTLPYQTSTTPVLQAWMAKQNVFDINSSNTSAYFQPWTRLAESSVSAFATATTVMAPILHSSAFSGDVNIVGNMNLFPSPGGTIELAASGGVIGLQKTGLTRSGDLGDVKAWSSGKINLSDADPTSIYSVATPLGYYGVTPDIVNLNQTSDSVLASFDQIFTESGAYSGADASIDLIRARHAASPIHAGDLNPIRIYASTGDITGFTLYSSKAAQISAYQDITDVSFYIQNTNSKSVSIISAGRDVIPYNDNAALRTAASNAVLGNLVVDAKQNTVLGRQTNILPGDIQISGPGTAEVLAGRNVDLGTGENFSNGTGTGITSIGNARNPFLPFDGSDLIVFAGVGGPSGGAALGLANSSLDVTGFLDAHAAGGQGTAGSEEKAISALASFFSILKQTGSDYATTQSYASGFAAIDALFGKATQEGEIFTRARDIRTTNGGAISLAAPNGGLTLASDIFGNPLTPPGVVSEYGGAISIFTNGSVNIGRARIFTLRGGDITIWSSTGDIAAGTSPKTVVTAPPTRVVIDSTSADIATDLGGLATGGGIGVLASVVGVKPGDVSLIAPLGTVDAGDAGIQATGNLSIAASAVLNADNISAGGTSSGVPSTPTVAAPNVSGLSSGSSSSAAANSAANSVSNQARETPPVEEAPSTISVEVLGYGGGESDEG